MADNDDSSQLISALEALCAQLEDSAGKTEEQLEAELSAAVQTTKSVIEQCVPATERAQWETELGSMSEAVSERPVRDDTVRDEAPGCAGCGEQFATAVRCIHDCDVTYCSAKCRKGHVRKHKLDCEALKRKALLRKLDIAHSDELF